MGENENQIPWNRKITNKSTQNRNRKGRGDDGSVVWENHVCLSVKKKREKKRKRQQHINGSYTYDGICHSS